MKRKIQKFFEDFFILAVMVVILYTGYALFVNDENEFSNTSSAFVEKEIDKKQDVDEAFRNEIKQISQDELIAARNIKDTDAELIVVEVEKEPISFEDDRANQRVKNPSDLVNSNLLDPKKDNEANEEIKDSVIVEKIIEQVPEDIEEKVKEKHVEMIENNDEVAVEKKIQQEEVAIINSTSTASIKVIDTTNLEKSSSIEEQTAKENFYINLKETIYKNIENNVDKKTLKSGSVVSIRVTILKDGTYEQLILTNGNKEFFNKIKQAISSSFPVSIDEPIKKLFPRYYRAKIEFN